MSAQPSSITGNTFRKVDYRFNKHCILACNKWSPT